MTHALAYDDVQATQTAQFLIPKITTHPVAAILTGTGLGQIVEAATFDWAIPYHDIPHFPNPTVESHLGQLVAAKISGQSVLIFQGRLHLYEGHSARAITFPIRVLQRLGVPVLILTNASGGLNPEFAAGDIMIIDDHINLTGDNPLIGANQDQWGPRFVEMSAAYSEMLRKSAKSAGPNVPTTIQSGVYAGLKGPSLETPAEMRFLRSIGADAVGFSTVMETIAAVHAGMRVLGLSVITNMCLPNQLASADVKAIIATAQSTAPKVAAIIAQVLKRGFNSSDQVTV